MNKTDRLLAIVLKLQSAKHLRAEDLAAFFETSKRTIYRDIEALSEAGVPVVAVPGQGYSLVEGYFLPPLSFSSDEAIMLLLGTDYLAQNFDARYQAGARSASLKISAVLPPPVRQEVEHLQNSIRFIATPTGDDPPNLKELRRAVIESRPISFRYFSRHQDEESQPLTGREADPYGLVYYDGHWYLTAFDHTRRNLRNFRLDRIEDLHLQAKTFERPPTFRLEQRNPADDRVIMVRVRFAPAVVRWVRESRNFYIVEQQEDELGLLVTLQVRQESDILGWLLSWGSQVAVLEPASLGQKIVEECQATLAIYQKPL